MGCGASTNASSPTVAPEEVKKSPEATVSIDKATKQVPSTHNEPTLSKVPVIASDNGKVANVSWYKPTELMQRLGSGERGNINPLIIY